MNSFVQSYNYDDSDGMVDYFDNNFYYFNCKFDNCKYVPKTARIKKQESGVQRAQKEQTKQTTEEAPKIGQRYTYKITKGEDTRDGSELWIVKILESLDKAAYIAENKAMKERGGYYSKFKKGLPEAFVNFYFRKNLRKFERPKSMRREQKAEQTFLSWIILGNRCFWRKVRNSISKCLYRFMKEFLKSGRYFVRSITILRGI